MTTEGSRVPGVGGKCHDHTDPTRKGGLYGEFPVLEIT